MKLYTVKEIRRYTGLSRKQLFDYQEGIPPYDHLDNGDAYGEREGYKRYDQEGLNKLSLAAMLHELGVKPKEINEIFSSENYNWETVLDNIIEGAKEQRQKLNDIILIAEYYKKTNLSELSFSLFEVDGFHDFANGIRKELKSDDYKNIIKNLDEKKRKKLIQIFKGFEKTIDSEDEYEKEKNVKKLISYIKNDLRVQNYTRLLTGFAVALYTMNDVIQIVNENTHEGFSNYIAELINEYQFFNLFDELEKESNLHEEEIVGRDYNDPEVIDFFNVLWKLMKKWYGLIDYYEAISLFKRILFVAEQDEVEDKEIIQFWEYYLNGFKYMQANKLFNNG